MTESYRGKKRPELEAPPLPPRHDLAKGEPLKFKKEALFDTVSYEKAVPYERSSLGSIRLILNPEFMVKIGNREGWIHS